LKRDGSHEPYDGLVEWMLKRPDAPQLVTPAMVRFTLLSRQRHLFDRVARAGLARFREWDAVSCALDSGDISLLEGALSAGARPTLEALERSILSPNPLACRCLVAHCDPERLQQAFDTAVISPKAHSLNTIHWLRDNVPDLCLATYNCMLFASSARDTPSSAFTCRCFRCFPPPAV